MRTIIVSHSLILSETEDNAKLILQYYDVYSLLSIYFLFRIFFNCCRDMFRCEKQIHVLISLDNFYWASLIKTFFIVPQNFVISEKQYFFVKINNHHRPSIL